MKEAARDTNNRMKSLLDRVRSLQVNVVTESTLPITWYQTLNAVNIELKFAYRHDVSGCAETTEEVFDITEKTFSVSARCAEIHDKPILYQIEFQFWAPVVASSIKIEHRPVGKVRFILEKANAPARWRSLVSEGSDKPRLIRLDIGLH